MRDYTKQPVHVVKDNPTREILSIIDFYLQDLSKGVARIQKGQVPDGSGDTIINQVISKLYWYKPGESPFGTAFMDTAAGGGGIIGSTTHATKGSIYFGVAGSAAFDEANVLWGVGTGAPTARMHLAVPPAVNQVAHPSGDVQVGFWAGGSASASAGLYAFVSASGESNGYVLHPDSSSTSFIFGFSSATNPGTTSGHSISIRALATVTGGSKRLTFTLDSGGASWFSSAVSTADGSLGQGAGYVVTTYPISPISATAINYSNMRFGVAPGGAPAGGEYRIDQIAITIPPVGGGGSQVRVMRMTDNTQTVDLNFASDGGSSEALTVSPSAVGAAKWAFGSAMPLLFATAGTVGDVWQRADTLGQGQWASASALATRFYHVWNANGPYRVDNDVDGARTISRPVTAGSIVLYRRAGGSSGGTGIKLLRNGVSVLSVDPGIAFNAGASATAAGTFSTTAFAATSVFTVSASAVDGGRPFDWVAVLEVYG